MSQAQLIRALEWAWIVFGAYWLIAARRRQATRTSESSVYRVFRLLVLVATFTLLFANWTAIGFLGRGFLPHSPTIMRSGFMLAILGMITAIWARNSLGQYWSDKIELKIDHQLIRSGPYARMRHPIYSGVLLGVAGSAVLVNEWRGVTAFFLLLTNYTVKAQREDEMLAQAFGKEFADHKRRAGFLLPRLFAQK